MCHEVPTRFGLYTNGTVLTHVTRHAMYHMYARTKHGASKNTSRRTSFAAEGSRHLYGQHLLYPGPTR